MHYNRLGSTGLFVSELCLGTMTFGASGPFEAMGSVEQADANDMVARAIEAGINLFDTADAYSAGASEQILGRALKDLKTPRDSIVIATKVFGKTGDGPNQEGLSRSHVLAAAKASLARLDLEHIDLYQLHGFDPATPIEETLEALTSLVRDGFVRYVGVSNWAAWQIAKALGISALHDLSAFVSLQAYYSVAGRDLEREIVPLLESEKLGLLVWSPLAGGFLSGKNSRSQQAAEGTRRGAMAFPPVNEDRAYDIIEKLQPIAQQRGVSVARLAIAWLLHQPAVTSVILGARRVEQLVDTIAAVDVAFSSEELSQLAAVSALPVEYPGWMLDMWGASRKQQLARTRTGSA